jgi:hypothetical protein
VTIEDGPEAAEPPQEFIHAAECATPQPNVYSTLVSVYP